MHAPRSRRSHRPSPPAARHVAAANLAATLQPAPQGFINAVQVYPFTDGALYAVYTAPERVTDIALQPGEALGAVAAGDTVRWVIGDTTSGTGSDKRTHVLVKPFAAGLSTNLVITTDRRSYHLRRDDLALDRCAARATVLRRPGRPEELLLRDGVRHVRLTLRSGTVIDGPVRLRFALRGLRDLERQLLTLRQVAALARSGRLPRRLAGTDPKNAHWIKLLRIHDALDAGASQREIADCLFDRDWVASGWDGRSDFMRSRLRRMIARQRRLVDGGYRALLR